MEKEVEKVVCNINSFNNCTSLITSIFGVLLASVLAWRYLILLSVIYDVRTKLDALKKHFKTIYLTLMGFPGDSLGKESSCNPGDAGDMGSIPGLGRSLEKEMATHSSILAWRISWTEEPGGLQSMVSQRVEHDWSNKHSTLITIINYYDHRSLILITWIFYKLKII